MNETSTLAPQSSEPQTLTAFGKPLRPITLGTLLVLQEIGHPFATNGFKGEVTHLDLARAFFVLTRPASESVAAIKGGRFFEEILEFADNHTLAEIEASAAVMLLHLTEALATLTAKRSQA